MAVLSVGASLGRAIDYGLRSLFDTFRPEPFLPREGFGGYLTPALPGGHAIDAATYQHNRHEAGLARLGAVRHT